MVLLPLIDKAQRTWLFKIIRELSKHPEGFPWK